MSAQIIGCNFSNTIFTLFPGNSGDQSASSVLAAGAARFG